MKAPKQSRHGHLVSALAIIAGALGVCAAAPAYAVLGGEPMAAPQGAATASTTAVARAAVASGASNASSTSASNYTVHTTTLASGTIINEYLSAQGVVFGVAWHGPRVPDLASLLGSYFPQYQQGLKAQRAARGGRGPVSVQDSGLVVESGGHMGSFAGSAYLPQSLPAGVSASDIQ
ncbi:hypothetical protein NOV72_04685 [Caballeronia novacaledonica]|uniref:DUF2844 domain-containing protein n=1 Tax=Caballeronia novacaledonica TaxID=1544861 RepID=A0A2U3IBK0_9BURK|nr:DUF2844 domain-containing protein [Caballeronia novacaledonica]SPB17480.1 hypothetical protein NOV72_04685 [Caballeronia novacaledonica]